MEGFPSGQREQTVNLSSMTSVVRIHHLPPKEPILIRVSVLFWCQVEWIRKPALRNVPVARFNRRGLPVGRQPLKYLMVVPAAKRIHHRTGRHACGSATMGGNSQSRQARALNGAPALRNSPVGCFNLRSFAAAKRIHHRTDRHACSSTTMGGNSQSRQAHAQSESQTSAPVSSLDKTGASVYNTDIRTALTCQVRSFPEQV